LISRLRADWCRVVEQQAPRVATRPLLVDDAFCSDIRQAGVHLRRPLRALARRTAALYRSDEGETFYLGALVDWHVARRLRSAHYGRVYRDLDRRMRRAAVWLLIDQSASTAAALGSGERSVLQTAIRSAAAVASALQAVGVACAIAGFSSRGRHAVKLIMVKAFDEAADAGMLARLQALQPGGSTRLGAALRHAASRLAEHRSGPRWVIVLSDGEPHDVDVHDPRYLIEDARHAVRDAARRAVQMAGIVFAPQCGADARRIFGSHRVQALHDLRHLPRVVQRILA
jgi:nitric oxide reductase activation protein